MVMLAKLYFRLYLFVFTNEYKLKAKTIKKKRTTVKALLLHLAVKKIVVGPSSPPTIAIGPISKKWTIKSPIVENNPMRFNTIPMIFILFD